MREADIKDIDNIETTTDTSLTSDDLIMEIGKLNVEKLGYFKEKVKYLQTINILKKQVGDVSELKKSNTQYSNNINKLDTRIVDLNNNVRELTKEAKTKANKIQDLEKELSKLIEEKTELEKETIKLRKIVDTIEKPKTTRKRTTRTKRTTSKKNIKPSSNTDKEIKDNK